MMPFGCFPWCKTRAFNSEICGSVCKSGEPYKLRRSCQTLDGRKPNDLLPNFSCLSDFQALVRRPSHTCPNRSRESMPSVSRHPANLDCMINACLAVIWWRSGEGSPGGTRRSPTPAICPCADFLGLILWPAVQHMATSVTKLSVCDERNSGAAYQLVFRKGKASAKEEMSGTSPRRCGGLAFDNRPQRGHRLTRFRPGSDLLTFERQ
jgi:hypothetical protein